MLQTNNEVEFRVQRIASRAEGNMLLRVVTFTYWYHELRSNGYSSTLQFSKMLQELAAQTVLAVKPEICESLEFRLLHAGPGIQGISGPTLP